MMNMIKGMTFHLLEVNDNKYTYQSGCGRVEVKLYNSTFIGHVITDKQINQLINEADSGTVTNLFAFKNAKP